MKRILVIAYYFPPYAGVGGIRAAKFVKYLPECDWSTCVLTIDEKYYGQGLKDNSYFDAGPSSIARIAYRRLLDISKIIKIYFPLAAVWHVWVQRKNIGAVMLCGSPFHPFLIAPVIRTVFKLPVILDYRDGWSIQGHGEAVTTTKFLNLFRTIIEYIGIRSANAVIYATPTLQDLYQAKYSSARGTSHTVYNGYDPDDFRDIQTDRLTSAKTVFISGKFYSYTPEVVHNLFRYLENENSVKFIYVGQEHKLLEEISSTYNVAGKIILLDQKPYLESIQIASGADICLVTTHLRAALGTKIFDYIALGKVVLCFVPVASQIKQTFGGYENIIINESPHTFEAVKSGIERCLKIDHISSPDTMQFTRKNSAKQLAQILNDCVN